MSMQYIILGLGKTGYSVVKFLIYLKIAKENILILDTRDNPPCLANVINDFADIKIINGDFGNYFTDGVIEKITTNTTIITSPGVDFSQPIFIKLCAKQINIWSDIELFAHHVKVPVVAITGSNGKSTTTSLLGSMAKENNSLVAVGGNLGIPALDLLMDGNNYVLYILELSSFQLQFTYSLATKISCILNITDNHLDMHKTFMAYCVAKHRIYNNTELAVYDDKSPVTEPSSVKTKISYTDNNPLFDLIQEHNLLGKHNKLNMQAALIMGNTLGFNSQAMQKAIRNFTGLPHRAERVAKINNILWINDSKATTVAATIAALDGLKAEIYGKWIIILGGKNKNSDFSVLKEPVKKFCKVAILLGETAVTIQSALQNTLPCFIVSNILDAVLKAHTLAVSGDGVLLSPACASWDLFQDYMQRGDVFTKCVHDLKCQDI